MSILELDNNAAVLVNEHWRVNCALVSTYPIPNHVAGGLTSASIASGRAERCSLDNRT